MSLLDNEKVQEWLIVLNDNVRNVKKAWLYALVGLLVLAFPLSLGFKALFFKIYSASYEPPAYHQPARNIEPLQILEKKVLSLNDNSYSGYVRLKNINLDWGVPQQQYLAVFKTLGGTTLTNVSGKTFILPASEKLIVFSKFSASEKPETLELVLNDDKFLLKPEGLSAEVEISRVEMAKHQNELLVAAVVKNTSPFKLKTVHLSALIYNRNNQIAAVNSTSVSELNSQESRSFQFYWPRGFEDATRAEIRSEINIFDPDVFETPPGVSPF